MKSKKILLTLIILSNMLLTGCPAGREVNKLAIVASVGIDKAGDGYLVTYQIINPKAIASKKSVAESPVILYTDTGKDLFEILRRITTQSPRKIYGSHLRTIVFGEEMAKEGIQKTLDFYVRDHEYRTDFYFLVAKGTTANNILKVITPLEPIPGIKLYDTLEASEESWAPTKTIKIFDLVNDLIADGKNPVLTGVEVRDPMNNSNSIESLKQSDTSQLILSSLAAFKKDKLAGWLNESESKGYNYITGNVKDTIGFIQYDEHNQITFEIIKAKAKPKVYLLSDKPAISVEILLKVNLAAQTGDLDITAKDVLDKTSRKLEEKTENVCNDAIKHTKELEADVFGFGEEIHRAYPKLWQSIKSDWNKEFVDLPVNVKVDIEINNLGEATKSIFSKGSK